jgi:hypothetical protein
MPLGSLPRDADIEGYHLEANGDQLLVFDTKVELPGGITAEQRDIVHFDGSLYWIEFDGSAHGVPADAGIDAVTRSAGGDLLLSFDTAVDDAADEDLVRFDGTGFSPYFDGSSAGPGVAPELDLDAAHELPNGHLLLSFDATGVVDGIGHSDEDLLEFDSTTGTWLLAFDASAAATPWPATSDMDAVAVPEPGAGWMLVVGVPVIVFMARRRVTR